MASRRLLNDDDDNDDGSRRLERGKMKERRESDWYSRLGRVRRARVVRKECDPKLASACV